jgi:hypothetical protein
MLRPGLINGYDCAATTLHQEYNVTFSHLLPVGKTDSSGNMV